MYNFYDDENQNFIKDIEYVKGLYETQVDKVKQEEYMKDLLFADYVRKVRNHKSRYDYIENVFKEAQKQVDKKKKKEREQLSVLEKFIRDDFFNNNSNFKIVNIMSGGYESYYWGVEIEGYGQSIEISIPNMNSINTKNFKHAHDGMFAFFIKESNSYWRAKKMSYKIEDIAEYIKEYFELDKVNEDEY
jgi:hypothetical protein